MTASPVAAGAAPRRFAVISHWMPFLLFSVWAGALADRYDCRRLMQIGQALFMAASAAWALLFMTDTLRVWHAVVLLTIHGFAGVIIAPASQLVLHDMVGRVDLHSAIRLNATSRHLAILLGPAVGGALLLLLGPAWGLLLRRVAHRPTRRGPLRDRTGSSRRHGTTRAPCSCWPLAPSEARGRIVGLFNTAMLGLRAGSGFTVGVVGAAIGIHWSLSLSAVVVVVIAAALLATRRRGPRRSSLGLTVSQHSVYLICPRSKPW